MIQEGNQSKKPLTIWKITHAAIIGPQMDHIFAFIVEKTSIKIKHSVLFLEHFI